MHRSFLIALSQNAFRQVYPNIEGGSLWDVLTTTFAPPHKMAKQMEKALSDKFVNIIFLSMKLFTTRPGHIDLVLLSELRILVNWYAYILIFICPQHMLFYV